MKKTYSGVEKVDCRATGGFVFCTLTTRKRDSVDSKILTLKYAGFSGKDMRVYMTETGLTAYLPNNKLMKCTVKDQSLKCTTS